IFTPRRQVKLAGIREDQLIHLATPIASERGSTFGYGHEISVREAKSADVRPRKAESLRRRHHERGALQALGFLLLFEPPDELVRNDAARHFTGLHHLRDLGRGNVDIGENRDVYQALAGQVVLQFAKFSEVVPQLRDDELRSNRDLQLQLVKLQHLVGLVNLVGVHNSARKEIERR